MEPIEYDINVLIKKVGFAEDFLKSINNLSSFSFTIEKEIVLNKLTLDNLKSGWDGEILFLNREDIGSFRVILRSYNEKYINMRFALELDSTLRSDTIDWIVHSFFLFTFLNFSNIDCVTAGECVVPYFVNEVKKWNITGDYLYLSSDIYNSEKLALSYNYVWYAYGKLFILK